MLPVQHFVSEKTSKTKLGSLSIPNLDMREKIEKVAIKKDKFQFFFLTQSHLFLAQIKLKT